MEYQLFIVKDSFKEVINENLIRLLASFSHDQYYEIQINKIFDYLTLNSIKENLIKLSIYNHILAHFYLWKIYNNHETKTPLRYLFHNSETINELTEDELKIIAKFAEDIGKLI